MRIAVLGAGHWHVPLYEEALLNSGAEIVAISAKEAEARERLSHLFGCPGFAEDSVLLDSTPVDFAFAFGHHREMFTTAKTLIERGIPFSIEKPAAFDNAGRRKLRDLAATKSLFVSFPLVYRVTPLPALIDRFLAENGALAHLSVRCFAGPPSRYLKNGSPWMVDPDLSGGGCTKNLAPHYVDLFLQKVGDRPVSVSAAMNSMAYGAKVEDYSSILVRTEHGAIATIETGYNFPVQYGLIRDFSLVASTESAFIRATETEVEFFNREGKRTETQRWNIDSNQAFAPYVHDVLRRVRDGEPPIVGFDAFNMVMEVIDASYLAREKGSVVTI
jgi:predicted dehydrogenase